MATARRTDAGITVSAEGNIPLLTAGAVAVRYKNNATEVLLHSLTEVKPEKLVFIMIKTPGPKNSNSKRFITRKAVKPPKGEKRENTFSKSRDTREDRSARQMKTAHSSQTFGHGR